MPMANMLLPLLLVAAVSSTNVQAAATYDPVLDGNAVAAHVNAYRRDHMVNDVVWDEGLAAYASAWATDIASRMALEHRPDTPPYGENLALLEAGSATAAVKLAADIWYAEVGNYDFAAPVFGSTTGHFTQLCWASTARVGAGVGKNGDLLFVVMNFDPPGNMQGAFEANVFPKMQLAPATPLSPSSQSPPPSSPAAPLSPSSQSPPPLSPSPPVNITLMSGDALRPVRWLTVSIAVSVALLIRFARH